MGNKWLIDYDSTLVDTFTAQIAALNARFNTEYTSDFFTKRRSEDLISQEEADFLWGSECFLSDELQRSAVPLKGALEGMRHLQEIGEQMMIVSDRPQTLYNVTREWLDTNGLGFVRLLFTSHKESVSIPTAYSLSKYEAAEYFGLTHIWEDAPHHAETFASMDSIERIFLLDKPHNRGIEHPKIKRIADWQEGIEILKEAHTYVY